MCAVPGRVIFCSSAMLLAPRIFSKFWSIRSLISPSTPTTTGAVYVLIIIIFLLLLLLLLFYFILFLFHTELVEEFWTSGQFVRLSVPCTPFTDKNEIDWDSATCITYSTDYYQRFTFKSW